MNILVPLNNYECFENYLKAGAKEYYTGFYDEQWINKFGEFSDINRMSGYGKTANENSFEDLLEIIPKIKRKSSYIYITFNSSTYSADELDFVRKYFIKLCSTNVDGVIVSNPELLEIATEIGIPAVISTIAGVYNSDIVQVYKKKGAKRIILPRDLSIEEITDIVKKDSSIEYEIFIMRNGCKFSDSNCLGFHRTNMCSICAYLDNEKREFLIDNDTFNNRSAFEFTDCLLKNQFHSFACGICGIYDFVNLGINAGKVVGRSDDCDSVCKDIYLINKNILIAEKCNSREEYLSKMHFPENRIEICNNSLSCYYPEIRF